MEFGACRPESDSESADLCPILNLKQHPYLKDGGVCQSPYTIYASFKDSFSLSFCFVQLLTLQVGPCRSTYIVLGNGQLSVRFCYSEHGILIYILCTLEVLNHSAQPYDVSYRATAVRCALPGTEHWI